MSTVNKKSEIPDAPFYVLSNDTFMSGWGVAEGRTNTCVLPCESEEEAERVARNARSRSDQKRVRIVANKPRLSETVVWSLLTKDRASAWYAHMPPWG